MDFIVNYMGIEILQLSTSNIGLPDATCILFLLSSLCGTCSTCQGHPTHFFINNMNSVSHTLYISQFSCSVVTDSLQPHGLQHARLPCPSPTPRAYSDSCPLCWWCHPIVSSSVVPFSSHLQSFPASGSFPMSWFSSSGGQSIGASASASVLPINIQDWFPLGWTGLILKSKGLSRVFSNTTVQKHQFFGAQLAL